MKQLISKNLLSAAVAATLMLGAGAVHAAPFSITEPTNPVLAPLTGIELIAGGYTETAVFNTNGTFTTTILFNAAEYRNNANQTIASGLGGRPAGYQLYAYLTTSGTYTSSGSATNPIANFTFAPGGNLSLYLSKDGTTTFAANSSTIAGRTDNGVADVLLATVALSSGTGLLDTTLATCPTTPGAPGANCGSFGTFAPFALTADGSAFFTAPVPFYNLSAEGGLLARFNPTGTQTITGSLEVRFNNQVPEPESIALFGIGLAGLGLAMRRRKQA